jgi:hypothetical protein
MFLLWLADPNNRAKNYRQVRQVSDSRRGSFLHRTVCCRGRKVEGTYVKVVQDQPNYVAPRRSNIVLHVSKENVHTYAYKSEPSRTHRVNGDADETG